MGMTPSTMAMKQQVCTGAPQQTETMSQEQLMRVEAGNIVPMQGGGNNEIRSARKTK